MTLGEEKSQAGQEDSVQNNKPAQKGDDRPKSRTTTTLLVIDEGCPSPTVTHVEGLTPVEQQNSPGDVQVKRKSTQPSTSSAQTSSSGKEVTRLGAKKRAKSSGTKMAAANNSTMYDIDLGDGANDMSEAGATNNNRPSTKDQENRQAGDGTQDRLKPEDAGKDGADSNSLYSVYMESDFRYYFQHPYARLFVAYFVTFCNFLIYAEDPVAHSRKECNIPVIGNCFAFVGTRYPPNAWSLLKVVLWLAGTVVGMIVGKLLFHTLLFTRLFRLKMFLDDKGSWMTMFLSSILCVFIFSYIYNAFLLIGGDSTSDYSISPDMSISNNIFMKAAATGTWCGDFFTAWMVTDMMLQEKLYPAWARRVRVWWNTRYNRIILFWVIVVLTSFIVIFVIATDYINWDSLNRDFLHSNELSRAFLASFILVMDIIIVMQDWDFPHFISAIDIKLPGINTAHIRFKIPRLLKRLEYWHVHITGKWFNYGILFIVILLDLNMWKNQIFYAPFDYGQYVDSEGRIHSVRDDYSLENFNESLLSFSYRNSTTDPITGKRYIELDNVMNARYNEYALGVKAIAFIPSIAVFIFFGVFVWMYGRLPKPSKDDPYGGRLKKRKRHFFRLGWKRYRKRFRTAIVALDAFKAAGRDARLRREREAGEQGGEETDGGGVEVNVVDKWKRAKEKMESFDDNGTDTSDKTEEPKERVKRQVSSTVV